MIFLADENFPRPAVVSFRERGFDVSSIAEDAGGVADELVLARCVAEKRTLLTLDKDFGELVFRHGLPSGCGVILFEQRPTHPRISSQSSSALSRLGTIGPDISAE